MDFFSNISPLDHRYRLSNPDLFARMAKILSEEALINYQIQAELALLKAHLKQRNQLNQDNMQIIEQAAAKVSTAAVYAEEQKTQHNIRALVNVLSSHLPKYLASLVHLGATSMDIVDTVSAMRQRDCITKIALPEMIKLENALIKHCLTESGTAQIGRTHGQYAIAVTVGHTVAEYVSRLGQSIRRIPQLTNQLAGKLSGAVGAYNATSLICPDPKAMEQQYLEYLGLQPAEYSTQIVMPEHQLRLLQELNLAFGVIANLADDLRHLQRSEINEVREFFAADQVGSSTMPQKRNPWNCEHIKSLWKAFAPRIMSFYLDQICEHQRDLSNSASSRFVADYLAGFTLAVVRMTAVVENLNFNHQQIHSNLHQTGDLNMAEPLYILLAMAGETDAHEQIRKLTLLRSESGKSMAELLQQLPKLQEKIMQQLDKLGYDASFLEDPSQYVGKAKENSERLALQYQQEMILLTEKFPADCY